MSEDTDTLTRYTTLTVRPDLHDRLARLKPYDSMSFNELLHEMADEYERENRATPMEGNPTGGT